MDLHASEHKISITPSQKHPGLLEDDDRDEDRQLLSEFDGEQGAASSQSTVKRRWAVTRYHVLYLLLSAGAVGIMTAILFSWTKHSRPWVPCGASPTEARAANCHYEPMLRAWVPDACYFPEPGEEYSPFEDRKWFSDQRLTQEIVGEELEKLRSGDTRWAYTKEFHDEHCVYVWRKLNIAAERRLPLIDKKTASFHHGSHCSERVATTIRRVINGTYNFAKPHSTSPLKFIGCEKFSWR